MGYASIETTMYIYAEVNDTKKKEEIENLVHNLDVFQRKESLKRSSSEYSKVGQSTAKVQQILFL